MWLQFGFVNFWQKDFSTKTAHKMLVKLTPGAAWVPYMFCNFYSLTNHKIENNSITTDGSEKIAIYLKIHRFFEIF